MINYPELVAAIAEWARENFGEQDPDEPLLGIIEELGELAHAHLKGIQGIRHTPNEIREMKIDAVADCVIYLLNYCGRVGYRPHPINYAAADRERPSTYWLKMASQDVGDLMDAMPLRTRRTVEAILEDLNIYCCCEGIDFEKAVMETWAKVRLRKWARGAHRPPA